MLSIQDLHQGETVRLLNFGLSPVPYRRRLLSLGLRVGMSVKVIRIAPLGCPVQINIQGVAIALRVDEAKDLSWERI